MATYAAYRHVELDKVGCGKRSIMKPPGGESRDIFGADFHGTPSHHRVLKPPGGGTSGLFATSADEADKSRGHLSNSSIAQNSTTALDGSEIESKSYTVNGKSGNELVPGHPEDSSGSQNDADTISVETSVLSAEVRYLNAQEEKRQRATLMSRNCVTGEGCQTTDHFVIRVHRQRDGNPVTGEGYDSPDTQTPAPPRTRIPPGGYSSGLW